MRVLTALILTAALALPSLVIAADPTPGPAPQDSGFFGPGSGGYKHHGGFSGPTGSPDGCSTVAMALKARDDTYCALEGHIINRISRDRYTFRDHTGSIVVDIDDKDFRGMTVTPETRVRLIGEVDRDYSHVELDVDYLEVVR